MNAMKNTVQLIGNVGNDPEIKNLDGGKKVANLTIATNDSYKNDKGEKVEQTEWHKVVAWGKTAKNILDKINLIGDDKGGLYLFDRDIQQIAIAASAPAAK